MNWIKNKILGLLLVLGSTLFGFAVFELFLIWENKSDPVERTIIQIEEINYPFVKDVNLEEYFSVANKETEIFVLGDSFVEGVACEASGKNFPGHLRSLVSANTRVINLGIGGKTLTDYIDWLDNLAIGEGDVVIVALYDNDIHVSPRNCLQINEQAKRFSLHVPSFCAGLIDKSQTSLAKKINKSIRHFKTVQLVKESLANMPFAKRYFYRTEYRNRWVDFQSEEAQWLISSLREIKDIVEMKGGQIHLTYYPNTNRINDNDPRHAQWLSFIEYVKNTYNIQIDDPYPYFLSNAPRSSMVWSLTDKHPSCDAHQLMAEHVYKALFDDR